MGQAGKCPKCEGKKIIKQTKNVEVTVKKGVYHNQAIILAEEGN